MAEPAPRERLLRAADVKLIVLAVIITAFTLAYPFGRDQGLLDVVGREWLRYGRLPYRDLVEHRPPPTFFVHGVLNLVLGDQMWGIRVVDLALTLVTGGSLAVLAVAREKRAPGFVGFGAFALAILYYGFYNFWDTAQIDWPGCALVVITLTLVVRLKRPLAIALACGFGLGLATLVKPPAALFALIPIVMAFRRLRREPHRARHALVFAGAGLLPWALTLGYFAAHHALGDYFLWVVRVNAFYAEHERGISSIWELPRMLVTRTNDIAPMPAIIGILCVVRYFALPPPDAERRRAYLLAALLLAAGVITLSAQMKFYKLHGSPCLFGIALALLLLLDDFARALAGSARKIAISRSHEVAALALVVTTFTSSASVPITTLYPVTLRLAIGELEYRWFARYFDIADGYYDYEDSYLVGMEVRRRAQPGDRMSVRGFEPQIYQIAGVRPATRFFWTNFITDSRRSLLGPEWLAEETRALEQSPPRFVVTLGDTDKSIVGAKWTQAHVPAYVEVFRSGSYRLLELPR